MVVFLVMHICKVQLSKFIKMKKKIVMFLMLHIRCFILVEFFDSLPSCLFDIHVGFVCLIDFL